MRTIKFRGVYATANRGEGEYLLFKCGCLITHFEHPFQRACILEDDEKMCDAIFNIDPSTIGQFTGLYDTWGKEIYEGDIVRLKSIIGKRDNFNDYEIKWSADECSFVLYDDESENYGSKNLSKKIIKDKELKVVGNIYEKQ